VSDPGTPCLDFEPALATESGARVRRPLGRDPDGVAVRRAGRRSGRAPRAGARRRRLRDHAGGEEELARFGLNPAAIRGARRATARACLDWSERRPHVAGALGAALLGELLDRRWLRRRNDGRALTLTPAGASGLASTFGVTLATIGTNSTHR
jgi:hypothetical protein